MHSWDAWGRGGDLGWPDIALRAHHKGSRDSVTGWESRKDPEWGTRVLGRGERACGDQEAGRDGGMGGWDRCARLGGGRDRDMVAHYLFVVIGTADCT